MRHLDLFSGIGGFALAVDSVWPDAEHIFCEIDPFCQAILKKHWPTSKIYGDIKSLTNTRSKKSNGIPSSERKEISASWKCDLVTGGFPCQPFSAAGKRKGTDDERHLWPQMLRIIQEFSPRFVVGENVRGLLSIEGGMVFEQVCVDLEALGYEVQPFVVPACAVNAPHRRDRVWIVARNTKYDGLDGSKDGEGRGARGDGDAQGTDEDGEPTGSALPRHDAQNAKHKSTRDEKRGGIDQRASVGARGSNSWSEDWPQVAAQLCTLDDGLPNGLALPRGWRNAALKGAGNAIVPQVAIEVLKMIKLCPPQTTTR